MTKRKMIKNVSFVLMMVLLINNMGFLSNAQAIINEENAYNEGQLDKAMEVYLVVEDELNEQNTSVLAELLKQKEEYQRLLNETNDVSEKEQLAILVEETEIIIEDYSEAVLKIEEQSSSGISPNSEDPFEIYRASVGAVVGYFDSKGYKLASELLTHEYNNTKLDSTYNPYYGYRVKSSNVTKTIAYGNKKSGSATFPNSGNTEQKDCYYAIHNFDYTKPSLSSMTVNIIDRYDYGTGDYESVAGVAVKTMRMCETIGILTPYNLRFSCTINK